MARIISEYSRLKENKEKMMHVWFVSLVVLTSIAVLMIASAPTDERLKVTYLALYLLNSLRAAYVYWRSRDVIGTVTKLEKYVLFSVLAAIPLIIILISDEIKK